MKELCYPNIKEREFIACLSNGLTVSVVPKPGFSKAFAMLAVGYGSVDASFVCDGVSLTPPKGVAHFLEHKVFEQPDGGNALQAFAQTGASPNAFTSKEMTAYHFSCTKNFSQNLEILLDFVSTPHFTDENVKKEQGIIAQEIGMVSDRPAWRVYENLMKTMFPGSPLGDSIIGTVESINQITRDTLFSCYRSFYRPSNMVLTVAGAVSPDEVCTAAEQILGSRHQQKPERLTDLSSTSTPGEFVSECMEVSMPIFAIGYQTGHYLDGLKEEIVADIALDLLAGPASKLYQSLYEQGLINREFEAESLLHRGVCGAMLSGEGKDPHAVRDAVEAAAKTLCGEVTEREFERAKRAQFGAWLRRTDSFEMLCRAQARSYLSGYSSLGFASVFESVTMEDVSECLERVFVNGAATLSQILPKEETR